ncbi:hypothetical protein [Shimazuella kribbensis]|uniref:hypothetical protein n=1 Tax=Shimazuella kribbensis TaxID=139808 RepID=UPI000401ED94|nr:hypothetical protein [Shimazuella kribbensis]
MPEHYNNSFYDQLDDLNSILGSILYDMEEKKEDIVVPNDDLQAELRMVKNLLDDTCLNDVIPVLDKLIATIPVSVLEESKVYSDIGQMIQSDKEILIECKTDINNILLHLENVQRKAVDRKESLLEYLEIKLRDTNVIILDTFYS